MTPRVAVVTAAFDVQGLVGDAVRSVLAQTLSDWEFVVVDDGSQDGTADAAEAAAAGDERVRVVRAGHSGMPAVARNRALRETTAPLVAVLDADDVWRAEKLERQVAVLDARPEVGLVHCAAERLVGSDTLPVEPAPSGGTSPLRRLLLQNGIVASSVVFRRALAGDGFDEDPRLRGNEDYELWLRIAVAAEVVRLDEPLVAYRVHRGQLSGDEAGMREGAIVALEKTLSRNRTLRHDIDRTLGILRCAQRHPGRGRRELVSALRANPRDALAWQWLVRSIVGISTVRGAGRVFRSAQRRARASS